MISNKMLPNINVCFVSYYFKSNNALFTCKRSHCNVCNIKYYPTSNIDSYTVSVLKGFFPWRCSIKHAHGMYMHTHTCTHLTHTYIPHIHPHTPYTHTTHTIHTHDIVSPNLCMGAFGGRQSDYSVILISKVELTAFSSRPSLHSLSLQ